MQVQTEQPLSAGIVSLLPIFYVGWSDTVLSPSEINFIRGKVESSEFLTPEDKEYLLKYTDPLHPPSEEIFREWIHAMQDISKQFDSSQKKSLSQLGIEMAKVTSGSEDNLWKEPSVLRAIEEIQTAMGLNSNSSLNLLLKQDLRINNDDHTVKSKALNDFIDQRDIATKQKVKAVLKDPVFAKKHIADKEVYRLQVMSWLQKLAQQGYGGYAFPKKYGGSERMGEHITIFESLAYHDLSLLIKFGVQFGLFGGALYGLGTEKHHKKYVESLAKAELLGNFAMTETGHGSNVRGLETTATYQPETDTIIVNSPSKKSGKEYIGNALHGSMSVVFAQLIVKGESHGVHGILVPTKDKDGNLMPGVEIEDCGYKIGLNGVDNGRIWYHNIEVPRDNLLNKYGDINDQGEYTSPIKNPNKRFFTMLGALVAGRVCVGMAGINAAKSALAIAVKHSVKRRQFNGKNSLEEIPIMDYPTHQRRLIPRLAKVYAYYMSMCRLADDYTAVQDGDMREIETQAAGLKAMGTWLATDTIQECREACGGKGYLAENQFAALKGDSDIFTTFEGDNTVLLQLVAKGLLTDFKQSFHDEGAMAVIKFLYSKLSHTMTEINPIYVRNTNIEHLSDSDFYDHAFRYRQEKLLITLSTRMRDYLKKRIHPFDAFLKCQNHMIALAKAYVERMVFMDFRTKVEACKDPMARPLLDQVLQVYSLSTIADDRGWFLENDYFAGSKSKAIRRLLDKRCQELRPEVLALVDGFGIPDELLAADIAVG